MGSSGSRSKSARKPLNRRRKASGNGTWILEYIDRIVKVSNDYLYTQTHLIRFSTSQLVRRKRIPAMMQLLRMTLCVFSRVEPQVRQTRLHQLERLGRPEGHFEKSNPASFVYDSACEMNRYTSQLFVSHPPLEYALPWAEKISQSVGSS